MGSANYREEDLLQDITACRKGNKDKCGLLEKAREDATRREKAGEHIQDELPGLMDQLQEDINGSDAAAKQLMENMQQERLVLQETIKITKAAEARLHEFMESALDAGLHEKAAIGYAAGSRTWNRIQSLLTQQEDSKANISKRPHSDIRTNPFDSFEAQTETVTQTQTETQTKMQTQKVNKRPHSDIHENPFNSFEYDEDWGPFADTFAPFKERKTGWKIKTDDNCNDSDSVIILD
ncbi:hypothetical protein B484DRAFT_482686 [Ochromonadaceae sp. CCMP2298]|nr:hypothetical protein B484DRAFT_482686 [Ochromonadaceae sp. CCMP2298]